MIRCSIRGCFSTKVARGYCQKHYKRFMNYGDPEYNVKKWNRGVPVEQRIMEKVVIDKQTGCWNFTGSRDRVGYGVIVWNKANVGVHRVMYIIKKGDIPKGLSVCHSCDNPSCCNPDHLWLGTHFENMHDSIDKGRRKFMLGENNWNHKLTVSDVRLIRHLYGKYKKYSKITRGKFRYRNIFTVEYLCKEFGIGHTSLGRILSNEAWKEV